jgi:hypothetical protein
MDAMLQTLFFPTMVPLFRDHPLTTAEQADLKAFFHEAAARTPAPDYTLEFGLTAIAGMLVLLAATGFIWHRRLRRVRAPLVEAAMRRRA